MAFKEMLCPSAYQAFSLTYFEVFEDLDLGRRLPDCKLVRVRAPHKLQRLPKRLVPPSQRGVDDVLTVATDRHKAAVGIVLQSLRCGVRIKCGGEICQGIRWQVGG